MSVPHVPPSSPDLPEDADTRNMLWRLSRDKTLVQPLPQSKEQNYLHFYIRQSLAKKI